MPRLWILSDLHLETVPHPDAFAPTPPDFDILVCAGDIWRADPARGFRLLRRLAGEKPVVCVLGNHEHWNSVLNERMPEARKAAEACGVILLQGDAVTLHGCRFIGTTLWTDYALAGGTAEPADETGEAIETGTAKLTIGATIGQHQVELARLAELINAHTGPEPLVVVTHHAPHPDCVRTEDHGTFFAGNGASDLSALLDTGRIDLWVHGHVHHSVHMALPSGTVIRCNPAGTWFGNLDFDDTLMEQTSFPDSPQLRAALKASSFEFGSLKTDTASVFIVLPQSRLASHGRWVRLLVIRALQDIERTRRKPKAPVLFLLDEFASVGDLPAIKTAFGLMAGYGLHLWTFLQNWGQLEELYGKGAHTFVANAGVFQTFNTNDELTARYVSNLSGDTTRAENTARTQSIGGKLLTPEEVMPLGPNTIFLKLKGVRPFFVRKVQYWTHRRFRGLHDASDFN